MTDLNSVIPQKIIEVCEYVYIKCTIENNLHNLNRIIGKEIYNSFVNEECNILEYLRLIVNMLNIVYPEYNYNKIVENFSEL